MDFLGNDLASAASAGLAPARDGHSTFRQRDGERDITRTLAEC